MTVRHVHILVSRCEVRSYFTISLRLLIQPIFQFQPQIQNVESTCLPFHIHFPVFVPSWVGTQPLKISLYLIIWTVFYALVPSDFVIQTILLPFKVLLFVHVSNAALCKLKHTCYATSNVAPPHGSFCRGKTSSITTRVPVLKITSFD